MRYLSLRLTFGIGVAALFGQAFLLAHASAKPEDARQEVPPAKVMIEAKSLAEGIDALNKSIAEKSALDPSKPSRYVFDLRELEGHGSRPIKLDLKATDEFWKAADQLAAAAKLHPRPFWAEAGDARGNPAIGFSTRPWSLMGQVYSDGPFRVALTKTRVSDENPPTSCELTFEIACEPRYEPILFKLTRDSIQVRGADSKLTAVPQSGSGDVRMLGQHPTQLNVRVPLPPGAKSVPELRGRVIVLVPPRFPFFESAPLNKSDTIKQDGLEATFTLVERDRTNWTVRVSLQYPAPNAGSGFDLESHQTWVMERNAIQLRPAAGKGSPIEPDGQPVINVAEGQKMHVEYTFTNVDGDPKDWKVRFTAPGNPVKYPLEFQFKNIMLGGEQ